MKPGTCGSTTSHRSPASPARLLSKTSTATGQPSALQINPKHKNAHEYLGEAYLQMGNLAKAKKDYTLLVQLIPRSYVPYYGLGEIAYREKDTKAARTNYERYLTNFPPESRRTSARR